MFHHFRLSSLVKIGRVENAGIAVIIQGAFLWVIDFLFYRFHLLNRKPVYPMWKG